MLLLSIALAATAQEAPAPAQDSDDYLDDLFEDEDAGLPEDLFEDEISPPMEAPEADVDIRDPTAPELEAEVEPGADGADRDVPDSKIEEILVTARGNPQSLLDAPMSVTAFDADYLEALGASDIRDLAQFTPNLEIKSSNAASNPKLFIRGVGLDDARANASSSVAVLVDDVYMNSPAGQLGQMFDLGSVEVLRGPQGVFYGRNATAGAIRLLSNKPSGEFGGALKVSYGEFDNGREGHDLEGYLEAPLFGEILSGRIAGKLEKREGYLLNRCGTPAGQSRQFRGVTKCLDFSTQNLPFEQPEKWLNDVDNWAARALLRLQPPGIDSDWVLNFHGGSSSSLSTQFQIIGTGGGNPLFVNSSGYIDSDNCTSFNKLPNGRVLSCLSARNKPELGDPYKGDYFRTGDENLDLFGTNLRGNWTTGAWSVDSITGYEWHDRDTFINVDGSPFPALESSFTDDAYQVTQELTARYDGDGFSFTLGGYVLYEDLDVFNIFFAGSVTDNLHPLQDQHQETRYYAGYLNGIWDLSEDFTLEGGIRINHEEKDFDISVTLWNPELGGPAPGVTPFKKGESSILTEPTGEITLRYRPTEDASFYAKFTRGFKGTHFNGAAIRETNNILRPAEPEFVDAMELGWKTRWFDGMVAWNGAGFYYNYQNQQVFQARISNFDPGQVGGATFINELINANDTRVVGVESDLTLEYEAFRTFFTFSYLFTEYTDFVTFEDRFLINPDGGGGTDPLTLTEINNFSGNRVVAAPEWSIAGYVQYALDLGRFGTITPRLDYSWRSEIFFTPDNDKRLGDDPRWLLHTRLGWTDATDRFELSFWVRNLTDEAYRVESLDFTPAQSLQQINYAFSVPRTVGMTFGVRF
jgi:iron complex outermembrane receptor protein